MTPREKLDAVVARLEERGLGPRGDEVRGYLARCPAHDDRSPSLSVGLGRAQPVVVHCFAGCSAAEIAAALELEVGFLCEDDEDGGEWSRLFRRHRPRPPARARKRLAPS